MVVNRLHAWANTRPHVLLVPVPGGRAVRWEAERQLTERGWPLALSPADADLLLVCGASGPQMRPVLDVAWDTMPGPRARRTVGRPDQLAAALASAPGELADRARQRADAIGRTAPALGLTERPVDAPAHGDMDHGDMAHGDMAHGDMDHGDMDHGDMDHGDMALPGGLQMADRAPDRDGLKLDVLHLSVGPVLPGWPAGLVLDTVLQGDIVQQVTVRTLDARVEPDGDPVRVALDGLCALLRVAGWADAVERVRQARDAGPDLGPAVRRIASARRLRWALRGLPAPAGVDLADYPAALLRGALDSRALPTVAGAELSSALRGLDLGSAALVVAAFGPRLSLDVPAVRHG